MPAALKKRPKASPISEDVMPVHLRYFLTLGLESIRYAHRSPAWRANFAIKYGKPEYRRHAWARLRDTLRDELPPDAFEMMDEHFTNGSATGFLQGFTHDQCNRLKAIITRGRTA